MDIEKTQTHDQAEEILGAVRHIQDSPELQAEAKSNLSGVLDRLGLKSDVTRHAVAFGVAGLLVAVGTAKPDGYW